jgi:hypothetical protein
VALIQARQVALPLVHHALTIASREVVRLGAEIPATVPEALRDVLEPEDAHGQLRQLAVSLEIVRDQAVLVGSEVVKRAAVLALSAVALLCEQALDAMLVDERPGQIAMAWA